MIYTIISPIQPGWGRGINTFALIIGLMAHKPTCSGTNSFESRWDAIMNPPPKVPKSVIWGLGAFLSPPCKIVTLKRRATKV